MSSLKINIDKKEFEGSKNSPAHIAVKQLSFSVDDGKFVAITGPSGCGKTTLLNMISGLEENYDGDITFGNGEKTSVVYLFQTPRLLPWRTVIHNIELVLPDDEKPRALSHLKEVGLEKFANYYPGQLSLGMQKRVSLARAFALEPNLLLLDEPFSSLDEESAHQMKEILKKLLANNKATTLMVTHDINEANELADRIITLSAAPATLIEDVKLKKGK